MNPKTRFVSLKTFKEIAGSLERCDITGEGFAGRDDFQEYITGSRRCRELMELAVEQAGRVIRQND